MWDFFTGGTAPWFIVILGSMTAAWWEFRKLRYTKKQEFEKARYESKLTKFKETNEKLFTTAKAEVLAAIATLSIFKKDPELEKNTIDVLLSRLYTELDYDIINSILTTLIQDSDRNELLNIADGLQDINRSFLIKEAPMSQRISDLNAAIQKLEKSMSEFETNPGDYRNHVKTKGKENELETEIYLRNKDKLLQRYNDEFSELFAFQKYKTVWHKQVTADAYAMFMRKAHLANGSADLQMRLFQNDFNWVYMAEVSTTKTCIERSAFGYSVLVKVTMQDIIANATSFQKSQFYQCRFYRGTMHDIDFSNAKFNDTVFEEIEFTNCKFKVADLYSVKFINCKGLKQQDFEHALRFTDECIMPDDIVVEHNEQYQKRIAESAAAHQ